jgi:hypothetical protein
MGAASTSLLAPVDIRSTDEDQLKTHDGASKHRHSHPLSGP